MGYFSLNIVFNPAICHPTRQSFEWKEVAAACVWAGMSFHGLCFQTPSGLASTGRGGLI